MFEEEYRKPSGISQAEAARRMGMSMNRLNEIVKGKRAVTAETALLFEALTGASGEFWLNLQARHDLWHAMQEATAPRPVPLGRMTEAGREQVRAMLRARRQPAAKR